MTMTEIRPDEVSSHIASGQPPLAPARGPLDWVTSSDHRRIGQLYVVLSLLLGVGSVVVAALAGLERLDPAQEIFDNAGLQLASLAALAVPFATVMPLLAGLGIAIIPQQVGARTVAFPRMAALSLWTWLGGVGLMIGAYAANGGPGGGDSDGVELFLLALGIVAAGLCMAAVCIGATVLTLRAPGMYLDRTPYFAWGSMVGAVLTVLTLPVLMAVLILLYIDHRYARVLFGGNAGVWEHISWVVRQPSTLIVALPALGILADVLPVAARARQQLAGAVYVVLGLAGVFAFGAWAQDAIAPEVRTELLFFVVSLVAMLPVVAIMGLGGLTLKSGKPQVSAPLIASLLGGLMLLAGVVNGALVGLEFLDVDDLSIVGTTAEMSQADFIYLGSLLIGLGGLVFWAPKLFGRRLPDTPMRGLVTLGFLATAAAALPNIVSAYLDQQPAYVTGGFSDGDGTEVLNAISAGGFALWGLVLLGAVLLVLKELATGSPDDSDPWGGHTLEWAEAPVTGVVSSDRPVLDLREASK